MPTAAETVDAALAGDRLAMSRVITRIERDGPDTPETLHRLFPRSGNAYQIGFTGPPGAGKSTLVDKFTQHLRSGERSPSVGIVAVDPTSPFTGGAILGDRIRMQQHYKDRGVFVRSMATRGGHGGLPGVARRVAMALDACGKDYVLIETVGVGQTELDIMEVSDTVTVVLVPESGDTIQTMKAGLMEIADVFAVNKADRDGAEKLANEVRAMLHLSPRTDWSVPVVLTQAHRGEGTDELAGAIAQHRDFMTSSGGLERKRQQRRTTEFFRSIEDRISAGLRRLVQDDADLQRFLERVQRGETDPYSASLEALSDGALLRKWSAALQDLPLLRS